MDRIVSTGREAIDTLLDDFRDYRTDPSESFEEFAGDAVDTFASDPDALYEYDPQITDIRRLTRTPAYGGHTERASDAEPVDDVYVLRPGPRGTWIADPCDMSRKWFDYPRIVLDPDEGTCRLALQAETIDAAGDIGEYIDFLDDLRTRIGRIRVAVDRRLGRDPASSQA